MSGGLQGPPRMSCGGSGGIPRPEVFVKRKHISLLRNRATAGTNTRSQRGSGLRACAPPPEARRIGPAASGGKPPPARPFARADRAVHRERNRTMARTKRSRRSYGAGEWGRNRVRVFPDPKTGLFQVEWRENGRRLTRSLGHREWVRAKRQADEFAAGFASADLNGNAEAEPEPLTLERRNTEGSNHGKKSRKSNRGCTICQSCRSITTALNRVTIAGKTESIGGNPTGSWSGTCPAFQRGVTANRRWRLPTYPRPPINRRKSISRI